MAKKEVLSTKEHAKAIVDKIRENMSNISALSASDNTMTGRIPTGILPIDRALHGGISEGKLHIFAGNQHGGKSTTMMSLVGEFHKKYPEKLAVLIDSESAFPQKEGDKKSWAEHLGIDLERLIILDGANNAEAVADAVDAVCQDLTVGLVVIDSIATLSSTVSLEESASQATYAGASKAIHRLISFWVTQNGKRVRVDKHNKCTMLFINQVRDQIGSHLPVKVLPNGKQQAFIASDILMFSPKSTNKKLITDPHTGMEIVEYSEHVIKFNKNREGGYPQEVPFIIKSLVDPDEAHPLKSNIHALVQLCKVMKEYSFLSVTSDGTVKISGWDVNFGSWDTFIENLKSDEDLVDYCSSLIIMVDRMRAGKTPIPPDGYLRCVTSGTAPEFVKETVNRLGVMRASSNAIKRRDNGLRKELGY